MTLQSAAGTLPEEFLDCNLAFTFRNLPSNLVALRSMSGEALLPEASTVDPVAALDHGGPDAVSGSEETTMGDTFWIIAEIIVGIAILGLLSAAITLVMTRLLTKGPPAAAILDERYSRGELTRAQYQQMREDLGIGVVTGVGRPSSPQDSRDAGEVTGSRQTTATAPAPTPLVGK